MLNAFNSTRNLFIEYTNYSEPLTFEQWASRPTDQKAAILYVQFFEQITLAWYKTKSFFVVEEDGVSTVLQYLVKNVPVILAEPKRFTANYIYRVAYNCLYCISHDIKRDIERWELEVPNIMLHGEDELDLFDTVTSDCDMTDELSREYFWAVIEKMGPQAEKVINHLLNGESLTKVSKRSKSYATDPLRDVSVSLDEMDAIIDELKAKLSRFRAMYNM